MWNRRGFGIGLLAFWIAGLAYGQPSRVLTPEECVRIGLQQNRTLRAAQQQAAGVTSAYQMARVRRLPFLRSQGTYQRLSSNIPDFEVTFPPTIGDPSGEGIGFSVPAILDRYDLRLYAEQPLFAGGRLLHSIRAAEYRAEAAGQEVAEATADVAYAIREAYWALVEAQAVQGAVAAALEQVAAHLQDVFNLRAQGMALQSDVLAVQTRQSEVRLQQVEADHTLRLARMTLNYRMGLPLETQMQPVPTVEVEPLSESMETLVARAYERRPELIARRYETQAREAGLRVARAEWLPQVSLVGTYYYARPNPYVFPQEDKFTGTWEAGVSMSMTLWNWGYTRAQVQQADARARQARAHLEDLREAVRLEVMRLALDVEKAIAATAVTHQGVQQAEEAYRVMRERVRHGMALTAEVLGAEAAYRLAQRHHAQALSAYAIARAALRRASGEPVF